MKPGIVAWVVCVCLLTHCAEDTAKTGVKAGAPPPAADGGASSAKCRRVQFVASAAGCHAAWSCGGATLLALTCVASDGANTCVCMWDEDAGRARSSGSGSCTDAGVTEAAAALCGWEL